MARDLFRDISAGIFQPIGDFVGGAVTALQPGRVQQLQRQEESRQAKMAEMQSLIDSREGQNLLRAQQRLAMEQGRTIYGSSSRSGSSATDPMVQAAVDSGKIRGARDKFGDEIPEETAAFFDAAAQSVTDRPGVKELVAQTGQKEKDRMLADLAGISKSITDTFSLEAEKTVARPKVDNRGMFSEGVNAFADKGTEVKAEGKKQQLSVDDFFQESTETLPNKNKPMTFEQAGVTNAQDQQSLTELGKALPAIDFVDEYNRDPERMSIILKAWREGIKDPVTGKMRKLTLKELQQLFATAGV